MTREIRAGQLVEIAENDLEREALGGRDEATIGTLREIENSIRNLQGEIDLWNLRRDSFLSMQG